MGRAAEIYSETQRVGGRRTIIGVQLIRAVRYRSTMHSATNPTASPLKSVCVRMQQFVLRLATQLRVERHGEEVGNVKGSPSSSTITHVNIRRLDACSVSAAIHCLRSAMHHVIKPQIAMQESQRPCPQLVKQSLGARQESAAI